MGVVYIVYRTWYVFLKKSGLIRLKFPARSRKLRINPSSTPIWTDKFVSIAFIEPREDLNIGMHKSDVLKTVGEKILGGELLFFNNQWIWMGKNYDWVTNPKTGYTYSIKDHWASINEFDLDAGDIKYVWEKSRFTYLITLMRYDYFFQVDCSDFVFSEITSWIKQNPVNKGPNWICSQEMSIRLINWYFVLHYYKNSPNLSQDIFEIILQSIYDQIQHVYANIMFSLKTVRNNHALTESLLLYISGHVFPFFDESEKWRVNGKKWFEQEIEYQIYEDGSYIQYSMNYHRVVVQLLTLALSFSGKVKDPFDKTVYEKAKSSLNFLYQIQNRDLGFLPNYGNNDGALFFPFNNKHFMDFRPQLNALHFALYKKHLFETPEIQEDAYWIGADTMDTRPEISMNIMNQFDAGGYFSFRDEESFTFIRCGKHENRPGQADNLHLNISLNGQNIMRDGGSYQYNADPVETNYFFGTGSHNTVMLGDADQMKKMGRFIWLYWSQSDMAELKENDEWFTFEGRIMAFRHIGRNIYHHRIVRKKKNALYWEVEDSILKKPAGEEMKQVWHPNPDLIDQLEISAVDADNVAIPSRKVKGMFSPGYGIKEMVPEIHYCTEGHFIRTKISLP